MWLRNLTNSIKNYLFHAPPQAVFPGMLLLMYNMVFRGGDLQPN
jgi:hypothetical protein